MMQPKSNSNWIFKGNFTRFYSVFKWILDKFLPNFVQILVFQFIFIIGLSHSNESLIELFFYWMYSSLTTMNTWFCPLIEALEVWRNFFYFRTKMVYTVTHLWWVTTEDIRLCIYILKTNSIIRFVIYFFAFFDVLQIDCQN